MATKPRKKIGMMPCEGQRCESHDMGRMVTVYESDSGTLGYHCDMCERSPYAKKGTGQYSEWVGDMVPVPKKQEAAPVAHAPSNAQVTAEEANRAGVAAVKMSEPKKSGFSLRGL